MLLHQSFELSMKLDNAKFEELVRMSYDSMDYDEDEDEYIDRSIMSAGVMVIYKNRRKKILLVIRIFDDMFEFESAGCLVQGLEESIAEYFNFEYRLEDFKLVNMDLFMEIDVRNHKNVSDYLRVIHRIGKIKGFSASHDGKYGDDGFCLHGNSNDVDILIYDLEKTTGKKRRKGIIMAEIRCNKIKDVPIFSDIGSAPKQIKKLIKHHKKLFIDVFRRIVPYGDYYKKDKAMEIVCEKVEDGNMRVKMLQMIDLASENKSLYLAKKSMEGSNVKKVMRSFAEIGLSPVTISKRHDIKHLENLYSYIYTD